MGTAGFAVLAILIVVSQASAEETAEEPTCVPGFMSDMMIIKVNRKHLGQGMRLGRVGFTDCTDISRFLFYSVDNRFTIQRDGTLMLKRPVVLHEGHLDILIKLTDMHGHKMTVTVRVVHSGHHHEHQNGSQHGQHHKHQPGHRHENQHNVEQHHGDKNHQNEQQQLLEEAPTNNTEATAEPQVPVLLFPKSSKGLSRRKRDWVIPPLNVVENQRGDYPLKVSQIRSNEDKAEKIFYSITGPGADQDPVGVFYLDRNNGNLYVTKPLDREFKDKYEFQAHAVAEGSLQAVEPMEIVVNVIDQNDNRPVFNKTTFIGEVPEASPIDFEIIQVGATDRDQPLTDNSDLGYRILEQDPEMPSDAMFTINPKTGWIRVNKTGLDRERYPNYTLTVQVADMMGEGLAAEAKVILTVSDSNDNAPVFSQSTATAEPQVPVLLFPKSSKGLSRRKRDWVIPPINVVENKRGDYPLKVSQIRSNEDKAEKIFYSITGPGADQDPVGVFYLDRNNGNLYVTKPLDREFKDKYEFQAHAVAEGSLQAVEPMEIVVNVIDQNDNRPVFNKTTFIGEVPEASPIDFEIIQVGATDRDQPLTDNSDLGYRILEQDPEMPSDAMFTINPKTGWIRVNKTGLDRERYPNYTLTVQVADMMGEGLAAEAKVILTVSDSNDNAPVFSQSTATAEPQVPVLLFPKSSKGLSRRKRDWVIPPINVVENKRGDYPLKVSQIRSNEDKAEKIFYSITGPGADQDPVGVFYLDRNNGNLYVTKPLDREFKDKYEFQAHAVAEGSLQAEEPMEIVINVIDQNDNRPVFNKTTFIGEVPEASPIDFEIIQVGATDKDQPLTDNSDLGYRILEQDPEMPSDAMFTINQKTGWIRLNKIGLDREKFPNYTLTVQVADLMGEGLTAEAKVILTVSDSNDNAPVFSQSTATAEPQVPVLPQDE